jgi:hypothetical protein
MAVHKIDGVDGVVNYPKKFVTLWADVAITKGDVVCVSTTTTNGEGLHVTNTGDSLADGSFRVAGVAAETVAALAPVRVQTAGYNADATSGAATLNPMLECQFDLASAAGKAGCLMTAAAPDATHKAFGLVVNQFSAAEKADGAILIYDHGMFG